MNAWAKVKLGDVLRHRKEFITIDDLKEYRRPRVQLHAHGIVLRDAVVGALIKTKSQQVCRAGEFLVAEIDAKVGGFGIVPAELDGSIVSSHYFLFVVEETKLDRAFLDYFIRTRSFREQVAAQGSTNYAAIRPAHVLGYEIPLPPLAEQRRVVSRIEELAGQIHEARTLRQQAAEDSEGLLVAMAHRGDLTENEKRAAGWQRSRLSEVMKSVDDSERVVPTASYPNLGIYSFGRGLFQKPNIDGLATSAPSLRRVHSGQFIYSRLFAFEGAYGMVTPEFDRYFVSSEYPTFDCDPRRIRAEFLAAYFKPSHIWKAVAVGSKGLGDRRQRVQPAQVLAYEAWIPPIEWQDEIARVRTKVDALKRLQAETAASLDAMLPAILDRAFKGELLVADRAEVREQAGTFKRRARTREDVRTIFAAEIVDRMHADRSFGQVKLQKMLFLCEYHSRVAEIEGCYSRYERGPHDPQLIDEVESKLKQREWFEEYRRDPKKNSHAYRPLARAGEHRTTFQELWPEQGRVVVELIERMLNWETERCERVATLYAAWNDLLLWKQPVTDSRILEEVLRNWHPAKLNIPRQKWQEALDWMRSHAIIPSGFGMPTKEAPQAELF